MYIGLLGAFEQEINEIQKHIKSQSIEEIGGRKYIVGKHSNRKVVIAFSKWGKVNAAATAATMINKFNVEKIVFTGVAGSISPDVKIGDIVVGKSCIQHDMDASPLFPKFEVPLTKTSYFKTCDKISTQAVNAALHFIETDLKNEIDQMLLKQFQIDSPQVHTGTILTGDKFINCQKHAKLLRDEIDNALAVEMEGAAVAQVCNDYKVPFALWRIISDNADSKAEIDFEKFANKICPVYAKNIVNRLIKLI
jgi:adenosylhomocysteine nucleosidase